MLWDTHMHTIFSGDCDADPVAMVQYAMDYGLSGICITDHLDYDYPEEPDLFLLDLEKYRNEIARLSRQFHNVFPIRYGIEIGLQPQLVQKNNLVTAAYPFDFVIGSTHVVHDADPYYPAFYEGRTQKEAYREYFEAILENVLSDADYDVYGHLDYVVRYGPDKNKGYSYPAYADIIDEILKQLIARGKGIELNTAGFKHDLGHPNPTEDILKRYRQLGGEIITIGADAHRPDDIAYAFDKIPDILSNAGFTHFTVFKSRRPEWYPIA